MGDLIGFVLGVLIISVVAWICHFGFLFILKKRMKSEKVTDEQRRSDFKAARNPWLFSVVFLVLTGPVGLIWYWACFRKMMTNQLAAVLDERNVGYADLM